MVKGGILSLLLNLLEGLLSNIPLDLPGSEGVPLGEYILDLFECPTGSFRETEEHMDERGKVEGSEDKVSLPRNIGKARRHSPSQCKVEHPW